MAGEVIGVQGVRITDLPEAEAVRDSDYMILVDEETGRTYKVKREHIKAQKTSELVDDVGFLRAIPGEYMTESEVRELTDAEIAKIREVLNTWTSFRDNGGSVGGSINANTKVSLTGDEVSFKSENHNKGLVFNDKVSTIYDWKNNRHIFRVDDTNSLSTVYANDFYFGAYSKKQTGYTKLPNGMLLQWGMIEVKNQNYDMNIWYPVSFSEYCLGVWFESHMNVHDDKREWIKYGTWNNHDLNKFTFRMEGATNWVYPMWFAIGY